MGEFSRENDSAIACANKALLIAELVWQEIVAKRKEEHPELLDERLAGGNYFRDEVCRRLLDMPVSGDAAREVFAEDISRDPDDDALLLELAFVVACYAIEAIKAAEEGKGATAWSCAVEANFWCGSLLAQWLSLKHSPKPSALLAKRRHAEHYALKAEALDYWRRNIDPKLSAAKAAERLIQVVPLSHRTLVEIVAKAKRAG